MYDATRTTQAQQELADMRADLAAAETHQDFEALFCNFGCEGEMPTHPEAIRQAVVDHIENFCSDCGLRANAAPMTYTPHSEETQTRDALGTQLKVGDMIVALGRQHRITALRPHPTYAKITRGQQARIADCDTGLSITIDDKSAWQVVA